MLTKLLAVLALTTAVPAFALPASERGSAPPQVAQAEQPSTEKAPCSCAMHASSAPAPGNSWADRNG